jgi:hypothetical protein
MMMMPTDLRVRIDERHRELYDGLCKVVVGDSHELFYVCACVGYARGRSVPLGRGTYDRFFSQTITPAEWATMYAMAIHADGMEFSILRDPRRLITAMEGYANGGLSVLLDECLAEYVLDGGTGPVLRGGVGKDLAKVVLSYVNRAAALC